MPKFSDGEKAMIKDRLHAEGERLFIAHGIKKVTVDDLVGAAGIAKGSFYAFYQNKEHLYMDITGRLQAEMWRDMEAYLDENRALPAVEFVKRCFLWLFDRMQRYPMLRQTNRVEMDYLYRKLPREIIEAHIKDDKQNLVKLQEYGVRFKCDLELAAKALQAAAIAVITLEREDDADGRAVTDIILDGVIRGIVRDEND
ncbi:MAG: TetR/AcrR family transcriptional regulator [Gracilibacteraceae bacterium]|jgi:AcrR family transcriptional regulator|nr:TetR/AcrR family transcriptional regulator [Gracilibacteraceae bacterium]